MSSTSINVNLGGVGPYVKVNMSKSFLRTQISISHTYVFELYLEYFLKSFETFFGIGKRLSKDYEVYHGVYIPHFREYYIEYGVWTGGLVTEKLQQLRCHLSWILAKDVQACEPAELAKEIETHFGKQLFETLKVQGLFHPIYYVRHQMKTFPSDRLENVKFHL